MRMSFLNFKLTLSDFIVRSLRIVAIIAFYLCGAQTAPAQTSSVWFEILPLADPVYGFPGVHHRDPGVIYDAATRRMTTFGAGCCWNDTWVLSDAVGLTGTSAWTGLFATPAPAPRFAHRAVYDPGTNRMTIFAGLADDCCAVLNDVWIASNANGLGGPFGWTQLAPIGDLPVPRYAPSATYDSVTKRMTIFGGGNDQNGSHPENFYNDIWVLTNANGVGAPAWTQLTPAPGPTPAGRAYHSAVYDLTGNRLIVFGGVALPGPVEFNDVWVLTNANGLGGTPVWTQLSPSGTGPVARLQHTATYDPGTNRMTVFGGTTINNCRYNDVWVLTNANGLGGTPSWIPLDTHTWDTCAGPSGPGISAYPRARHGAVYDQASNRMMIFGGWGNPCCGGDFGDVWVLTNANGLTEIPVTIAIKPPSRPPVPINLGAMGVIPVAILSTSTFDATQIKPETVTLSGAHVRLKGKSGQYSCSIEDVNSDALPDLLCQVPTQGLQLQTGASEAVLTAKTFDNRAVRGTEAIILVPAL